MQIKLTRVCCFVGYGSGYGFSSKSRRTGELIIVYFITLIL